MNCRKDKEKEATSDTTLRVLQELHQQLDGIFKRFSVEDTSDWEAQWEAGCAQQREELTKLAARPPFFLANEVGNGKKLREALQTLRGAVNKDREGGEMRDLRQRTVD
ncbi:hypothetical protein P3T76_005944 [Phytophthora citrophthora]|uniref:Uncharacterized protein n=1 Tax=Phytophthora citrophthora TaxID=4793 RepID=A0AAD9GPL7_9STRA|nr:hypothetical protein P3T76_005944 [Phytophthora citrophthora]